MGARQHLNLWVRMMIPNVNEQLRLKRLFAENMLRNPDPFAAVRDMGLTPESIVLVAQTWPNDPEVLAIQKDLLDEHGSRAFLPSREQIAREIHAKAKLVNKPGDYEKLMRLYSDMMGFIEKPGVTVNNNTQQIVNVMKVPMAGNPEEWEARAVAQQSDVMNRSLESEKKNAIQAK